MATPDQQQSNRSQFCADAIRVAITTTKLATPVRLPPGFYQLYSDVGCRWKQAGSWCTFADTTPTTPTVANVGAGGATTYTYVYVAVMPDAKTLPGGTVAVSGKSPASAGGSTATGNATLSGTNFNRLTLTAVPGAASYDVYRTVGGATQGFIGSTTSTTFDDTGLAGDSTTAPAASTSVGDPLPANTFFGDVFVDGAGNDDAWFNVKADGTVGTIDFIPVTP